MSTYDQLESSVESSRPIELFTFVLGAVSYYYTSSEDDVTFSSILYEAIGISRDELVQGPDDRGRVLSVTLPANNPFAALYIDIVPASRASLTVQRLQRDETPSLTSTVLFKGMVKSVLFSEDGRVAKIAAQSLEAVGSRAIPRWTFQGMCNHQLYDAGCGVDSTLHRITGTVTSQVGNLLTVTGVQSSGFDFIGGFVKSGAALDFRMVLFQSADTLTLLLPFGGSVVGMSVDVFKGCDHIMTGDCAQVFDNVINFGGFAFVPTKNPFATGLD